MAEVSGVILWSIVSSIGAVVVLWLDHALVRR
jgi:hypothetical protein